jgi:hypothetical protein
MDLDILDKSAHPIVCLEHFIYLILTVIIRSYGTVNFTCKNLEVLTKSVSPCTADQRLFNLRHFSEVFPQNVRKISLPRRIFQEN